MINESEGNKVTCSQYTCSNAELLRLLDNVASDYYNGELPGWHTDVSEACYAAIKQIKGIVAHEQIDLEKT